MEISPSLKAYLDEQAAAYAAQPVRPGGFLPTPQMQISDLEQRLRALEETLMPPKLPADQRYVPVEPRAPASPIPAPQGPVAEGAMMSDFTNKDGQEVPPLPSPSVGRIVHYTNLGDRDGKYPPQIIAALVTKVNEDGTVALKAFYPTGIFDMPSVMGTDATPGSEAARGKWAWPARS